MVKQIKKEIKHSPMEKVITLFSLGILVGGMFLGFHGITGNMVAEHSSRFFGAGMSLFLLGLFGIWIANKDK
jgi:hypothetical protein